VGHELAFGPAVSYVWCDGVRWWALEESQQMKRKNQPTQERCIRRGMLRFLREDDGPTATEYAFMLAMIILASVGAITVFSDAAITIIEEVTTTLTDSVGAYL